jgi:nucleotide-binding universal stress UspA family protein
MSLIDIKRILCPVDLSETSRRALTHAVALARWYEARVTVLHVFQLFGPPQLMPADPGPMISPYPTRDVLTADVTRFIEPLKDSDVPFDVIVEEGHVARTIVETSARLPADLIVMGTHGRGGVDRLMLGSVTEKVLRRAGRPVLIVPPATAAVPPPVRFDRILCPVDFGPSSMKGLEYALSLAQEAGGTLTALHVVESLDVEWLPDVAVEARLGLTSLRRQREDEARDRLRAAIPAQARDWCHPVELVATGKPYPEILRVAQEISADLIVIGVAGRGAVDLMFFGSTTNHVVRAATCPVLTVRAPDA